MGNNHRERLQFLGISQCRLDPASIIDRLDNRASVLDGIVGGPAKEARRGAMHDCNEPVGEVVERRTVVALVVRKNSARNMLNIA